MARGIELQLMGILHDGRELAAIKETSPEEYAEIIRKISDKAFEVIGMERSKEDRD